MNYFIKIISVVIITLLQFVFIFSNIGFYGQSINVTEVNGNEPVELNYNLVNREDLVKAQIEVIYELRRISDLSLMYESYRNFSFAPYEVKRINETLNFGKIPPGEYTLVTQIRSGAGSPLGRLSNELNVYSSLEKKAQFSKLPYLRIFYTTPNQVRYENSYSNVGRPTGRDEDFEVRFELENLEESVNTFRYEFNIKNSYSSKNMRTIFSNEVTLNEGEKREIVETIQYNESGTFDLFVKVFDDESNQLANKEVRLVVVGDDGTILDVFNQRDGYEQNELVTVNVSIVGPADSLSLVENSTLMLNILEQNEIIYEENISIDILPTNPENYKFSFIAPEELKYYKLRVTLENDGNIYDQVELSYEPLFPELIISPTGAIYDPSLNMCLDDNKCTQMEKNLGNCADCVIKENNRKRQELKEKNELEKDDQTIQNEPVENEERNPQLFNIISVSLIILLGGIAIYYIISNTRRDEQ